MKKIIIFVLTLTVGFLGVPYIFSGAKDDVKEYLKMFDVNYVPTVSDFYSLNSREDLDEVAMEMCECEKRGLRIAASIKQSNTDKSCADYMKRIAENEDNEISLYFKWLRTILPLSPKVKILKVIPIKISGYLPKEKIIVRLNKTTVTFERQTNDEARDVVGPICLMEVNGVNIKKMFDDYQNKECKKQVAPSAETGDVMK